MSNKFLSSPEFLRDLLLCLRQDNGNYIIYDANRSDFLIDSELNFSTLELEECRAVLQFGFVFRKIDAFLQLLNSRSNFSLILASLRSGLIAHQANYERVITLLSSKISDLSDDYCAINDVAAAAAAAATKKTREHCVRPIDQIQLSLAALTPQLIPVVHLIDRFTRLLSAQSQGGGGGEICSEIFRYMEERGPNTSHWRVARDLLDHCAQSLFEMITKWMFEGVLDSTNQDFFIVSSLDQSQQSQSGAVLLHDNWWASRYRVRHSRLPCFISNLQAKRIFITGKTLNFIHEICRQSPRVDICHDDAIRKVLRHITAPLSANNQNDNQNDDDNIGGTRNVWSLLYKQDVQLGFAQLVEVCYRVANQRLLRILLDKHQLVEHLFAMRQYLLQGRGDFIHLLMSSLEKYLDNPADKIASSELFSILRVCIDATSNNNTHTHMHTHAHNSHSTHTHANTHILERLEVRTLDASPGDSGWDVFSLNYSMRGDAPLSHVFTVDSMKSYLIVFNFLWRLKRMEFVLGRVTASLRNLDRLITQHHQQQQHQQSRTAGSKSAVSSSNKKHLRTQTAPLLHIAHLLVSQMQNFIFQLRYYINHGVLEVAWTNLLQRISAISYSSCSSLSSSSSSSGNRANKSGGGGGGGGGGSLDDVIEAHVAFLNQITKMCLLDGNAQDIQARFRSIFDLIVQFDKLQAEIGQAVLLEINRRRSAAAAQVVRKSGVTAGTVGAAGEAATDKKESQLRSEFASKRLQQLKSGLQITANSYKESILALHKMIHKQSSVNLDFLIISLNFNCFYGEV